MANTENANGAIKLAGYLEKKGKKRVVSIWKKYWFVLEGRLLLYYKSQSEVTNLCPCRGSINMGLATDVRPLTSQTHGYTGIYVFEIVTHINNTVLLRTKNKATQDQWLQALLDALCQPKINNPMQLNHFRYSMDSLMVKNNYKVKEFKRQNTLPQNINLISLQRRESFFKRIKRIRGSCSQSLDAILKQTENVTLLDKTQNHIVESSSDDEKELERDCTYEENESDSDIDGKSCNSRTKYSELTTSATTCQVVNYEKTTGIENDESGNRKRKSYISFKFSNKEDESNKFVKVKRKNSFLQKFFKHKKKDTTNGVLDDVDYKCIDNTSEKSSNKGYNSSDDVDINITEQKKNYGVQEVILPETLHELNEKLKPLNPLQENQQAYKSPYVLDEKKWTVENEQKCPELPPRTGIRKRSQSPIHDIPKNNTIIVTGSNQSKNCFDSTSTTTVENENIEFRLKSFENVKEDNTTHLTNANGKLSKENINSKNCSENKFKKGNIIDSSELTVRELIEKFNQCNVCVNTITKFSFSEKEIVNKNENITLRKEHYGNWINEDTKNEENRNSEELHKLLDELSKITTPPLIEPRVTNSLIQEKTKYSHCSFINDNHKQLTNDQWLLLFPIRKRRYSEPDYDVPRSHRSYDFVPPLPPKISHAPELLATRFMETAQSPNITEFQRDCTESDRIQWLASITPDSLEPTDFMRKQDEDVLNSENMLKNSESVEKNLMYKSNENNIIVAYKNIDANNERFLDSLEQSTLF